MNKKEMPEWKGKELIDNSQIEKGEQFINLSVPPQDGGKKEWDKISDENLLKTA